MKSRRWRSDFSVRSWRVKLLIVIATTVIYAALGVGITYYINLQRWGHVPPYAIPGALAGGLLLGLLNGISSVLSKGARQLLALGLLGLIGVCAAGCLRALASSLTPPRGEPKSTLHHPIPPNEAQIIVGAWTQTDSHATFLFRKDKTFKITNHGTDKDLIQEGTYAVKGNRLSLTYLSSRLSVPHSNAIRRATEKVVWLIDWPSSKEFTLTGVDSPVGPMETLQRDGSATTAKPR